MRISTGFIGQSRRSAQPRKKPSTSESGGGTAPAMISDRGGGEWPVFTSPTRRRGVRSEEEWPQKTQQGTKSGEGIGGRVRRAAPEGWGWSPGFSRFGSEDRLKPGLQPH